MIWFLTFSVPFILFLDPLGTFFLDVRMLLGPARVTAGRNQERKKEEK